MPDLMSMRLAPARRAAATWSLSHTSLLTLGMLFLALCGWKFTTGLSGVLDLDTSWHEARYLAWVTHHAAGPVPPEYSPLYVAFLRLEQLFAHDPVRLYYLHASVIAVLLPIAFFAYLTTRAVPFVLALPTAAYLMISAADLPVAPKPVHLALVIMFAALAVFVRLGERPSRWALILATGGILSLVRPEFLLSLGALTLFVVGRALVGERRIDWRIVAAVPLAAAVIAPLWWLFGVPLFNERSMDAFSRHFALNYVAWNRLAEDPLTADHLAIFHRVFGDAGSIPAAFAANPAAFLHHVGLNLWHAPRALIELFLAHYNILLPRFRLFTAIEAVLLGLALAAAIALAWQRRQPLPGGGAGSGAAAAAAVWRRLCELPDAVCLLCFLIPFPIMITVLYPRYHYVLGMGLIPLAIVLVAVAPRLRLPEMTPWRLVLVLPLVFALIPSLGSAGASFTVRKVEVESRPHLNLVELLRQFRPVRPVNILEAAWVEPYLDSEFNGVSDEEKTGDFLDFIKRRDIGAVIANDRLRNDHRFSLDPEWYRFKDAPARFGFRAYPVEESDIIVYIRDDVLGGKP